MKKIKMPSIIKNTINNSGKIWKLSIIASASQSGIPKFSIILSKPENKFSFIVFILLRISISIF